LEEQRLRDEDTARHFQNLGRFGARLNQDAITKWLENGPHSTEIQDRQNGVYSPYAYDDRNRKEWAKEREMSKPSDAYGGKLAREAGFDDIDPNRWALEEARQLMGQNEMPPPPKTKVPLPRPNPFRRPKFASGGFSGGSPWQERAAARSIVHAGMLKSNVPGRTDKLPITVGGGAFIVPADHLAALGQGNSQAGASIINGMFGLGGNKKGSLVKAMRPQIPKLKKMAEGGDPGESKPVDIIAAGGEFVIPPGKVQEIGGGDLDRGHKILHQWVLRTRKQHIKTLEGLQPPKT